MSILKPTALATLLLLTFGPACSQADESAQKASVEKLFVLTGMQQQIDDSLDNVLAIQLAQNPALREHEALVREFLERHIGWQSMRDALTGMYLQEFTGQELADMNAFYGSTTGQKVIKRLPVLVQQRNKLAAQRMQENIGELEYQIRERSEKQP